MFEQAIYRQRYLVFLYWLRANASLSFHFYQEATTVQILTLFLAEAALGRV
jgi:hypothetical protein